jgi:hypothetical protein
MELKFEIKEFDQDLCSVTDDDLLIQYQILMDNQAKLKEEQIIKYRKGIRIRNDAYNLKIIKAKKDKRDHLHV